MDTVTKFRAALAGVDNPDPIAEEFAQIAAMEIPRWRLLSCEWSNYYSYERGSIDFVPDGLRGVIAPNCSGKTTIIDVISIALFNSPRGKRQDAIRAGAARAEVIVKFDCAGEYTVTREDTAARAVVTLSKINEFGASEEVCGGQRAVYAALESLIGTRERFMYLTLYDPAYDLFMLSPLDRQRALPSLLGLASIDELCEKYTREAKEHQRALAALGTPPTRVDIATIGQPRELGPRPANRWRDAIARIQRTGSTPKTAAEPVQCEPDDLTPRQWPARDIVLAIRACGFWPTAEEIAGQGRAGDLPALFAEWKRSEAAASRVTELTARSRYKFNPSCDCCAGTRALISADLTEAISNVSPTARGDLSAAVVAELRAEQSRGADNLPGKYAYAVMKAAEESAADMEWVKLSREADRINSAIKMATAENSRADKYDLDAPRLRNAFTRAQTAAKILKSEEFRTATARGRLADVIDKTNMLIEIARGGFKVRVGPDLDFWIDEYLGDASTIYSAEITRGSGYQKFLAGVCCRLALSDFVIIDEGFGVVDPAHLPPLLAMLKSKRAFILAHTEEIAAAMDSPIRILRTGVLGSIVSIIGEPPAPPPAPVPINVLELIAPTTTGSSCAYECVCGSSITNAPASISAHNKTTKHRKYMAGQN